ncbi:MAG: murein L,D-transpeptidase, partial [Methylocystis sp.]|nr:murein L,D-transpeptidase [Methylocystis sp.]
MGCGLILAAGAAPVHAEAEWAQRYDVGAQLTVSRSTTPLLSAQTVAATEQSIEQLRGIVANGGWPQV